MGNKEESYAFMFDSSILVAMVLVEHGVMPKQTTLFGNLASKDMGRLCLTVSIHGLNFELGSASKCLVLLFKCPAGSQTLTEYHVLKSKAVLQVGIKCPIRLVMFTHSFNRCSPKKDTFSFVWLLSYRHLRTHYFLFSRISEKCFNPGGFFRSQR